MSKMSKYMRFIPLAFALATVSTGRVQAQDASTQAACAADFERLCFDQPRGSEIARICLRNNIAQVSAGCRALLTGERQQTEGQQPAAGAPPRTNAAPAGPVAATRVSLRAEQSQPNWLKICGRGQGPELCYVTRDFVSEQGQPLLSVAMYELRGAEQQRVLRFLMPLGLNLDAGIRIGVDQREASSARFTSCFPNGCFAEARLAPQNWTALRQGGALNVSVINPEGREIMFAIPLAGFAAAVDGAAVDQRQMDELTRRAAEQVPAR